MPFPSLDRLREELPARSQLGPRREIEERPCGKEHGLGPEDHSRRGQEAHLFSFCRCPLAGRDQKKKNWNKLFRAEALPGSSESCTVGRDSAGGSQLFGTGQLRKPRTAVAAWAKVLDPVTQR